MHRRSASGSYTTCAFRPRVRSFQAAHLCRPVSGIGVASISRKTSVPWRGSEQSASALKRRKSLGKDHAGPPPIGVPQGRAANQPGPQVVMVHGLRAPHRLNFAQARPAAQLRSDQPHQMVLGRKPLDVFVPFVALHDRCEAPPRKHFQQIAEHRILIAHAKLSFLNLVNQKDTAKPRRCLACKLLNRPIPRTALRFYGNPGLEAWAVAGALARDRVAQRQFVEPKKSVHPIG